MVLLITIFEGNVAYLEEGVHHPPVYLPISPPNLPRVKYVMDVDVFGENSMNRGQSYTHMSISLKVTPTVTIMTFHELL